MSGGDPDFPDLDPEALARAEVALARLADNYLTWAEADCAALRACLAEGDMRRLFAIAHDMKGQAATFGYPLITEVAHRLCRLIDATVTPDVDVVTRHVDAIAALITGRLGGDCGEVGRAIVRDLD